MNAKAPLLMAIPVSLWALVAATFVNLGAQAGTTWLIAIGYFGVIAGSVLACAISHKQGWLEGTKAPNKELELTPSPAPGGKAGEAQR